MPLGNELYLDYYVAPCGAVPVVGKLQDLMFKALRIKKYTEFPD